MSILLFRSSNILHQLKKKTVKKNRCCMVCWLPCSSGLCCGYSVKFSERQAEICLKVNSKNHLAIFFQCVFVKSKNFFAPT